MIEEPEHPPTDSTAPAAPTASRVPMVFAARSWSYSMGFNRSGRGEGESLEVVGAIAVSGRADNQAFPARAIIIAKDAKVRLELNLTEPEALVTVPLEEFALGRVRDAMKEYSGSYGLALEIAFEATATPGRQLLEGVQVRFRKGVENPKSDAARAPSPGHEGGVR